MKLLLSTLILGVGKSVTDGTNPDSLVLISSRALHSP